MSNVALPQGPVQPEPSDQRPNVVKSCLLLAGSVITTGGTYLATAGAWGTPPELVKYALNIAVIVFALVSVLAAIYLWRR